MAEVHGPYPNTLGEKILHKSLLKLPEDWLCYSQPHIAHPRDSRYPDFVVIHKEYGFTVLEVKDWVNILEINDEEAKVKNVGDEEVTWQTSPVKQARQASIRISELLINTHGLGDPRGKLPFPYRYAGILPKINLETLRELRTKWGASLVFGVKDIEEDNIEMLLIHQIEMKFKSTIEDRDLEILRTVMDRNLVLPNGKALDKTQENLAKEPIGNDNEPSTEVHRIQLSFEPPNRFDNIENNVPEEVRESAKSSNVRLIRGAGGTGKTDVVILRCKYLRENFPEKKILLTTFNEPVFENRLKPELERFSPGLELKRFGQICNDIYYQRYGLPCNPQRTIGFVNLLFNENVGQGTFLAQVGPEFIADEIEWLKELDLTTLEGYLSTVREGRAAKSGQRLTRNQKVELFNFFLQYQARLQELPALDWIDLFHRALVLVKSKLVETPKYDEILIDEAQHFAPKWMELILLLLCDNGTLFLSEDPNQSVYRSYSWSQKGVLVRGRTRLLKKVYRSTKQIIVAAYSLIQNNRIVQDRLQEELDDITPDFENPDLRSGERPQLHMFTSWTDEREFIRNEIMLLNEMGFLPKEIAVLHPKKHVRDSFGDLHAQGVSVDDVRRVTGMDYRVVFIPNLYNFCQEDRSGNQYWVEDNISALYTGITRAKDLVYLSHDGRLPKEFLPILPFCEVIQHNR